MKSLPLFQFEATEEQLREICRTVGHVVALQIMHDRETGRPRGHALCEFRDQETAQSAVRNLNGYDFMGRTLRVSPAEEGKVVSPNLCVLFYLLPPFWPLILFFELDDRLLQLQHYF